MIWMYIILKNSNFNIFELYFPGSMWYILAILTSNNPIMHRSVMSLEFMLGPGFVLDNIFRCATIFGFLAFMMITKAILTIGFSNTMHYFTKTSEIDAYDIVTSDLFLRGTLVRNSALKSFKKCRSSFDFWK